MNLIKSSLIVSFLYTLSFSDLICKSCSTLNEQNKIKDKIKEQIINDNYLHDLHIKNSAESNYYLGLYFENKDKDTALIYFNKAIEKGYFKAFHHIALLHSLDKDKMEYYLLKSVEHGFNNDLLNLFILTQDSLYLEKAFDKNVENSYNFAAKYYYGKKEGRKYASLAYSKKESFIEHYLYTKNISILEEGIKNNDLDSISLYTDDLFIKNKYKEILNLNHENMNKDFRLLYNRAAAFAQLNQFRNAKYELNKLEKIINLRDPLFNKYTDINLMYEKIKAINSYVCSKANVCRDF